MKSLGRRSESLVDRHLLSEPMPSRSGIGPGSNHELAESQASGLPPIDSSHGSPGPEGSLDETGLLVGNRTAVHQIAIDARLRLSQDASAAPANAVPAPYVESPRSQSTRRHLR